MNDPVFTLSEIEFLRAAQVGRLATVGANGHPHMSPVVFTINDGCVDIGGAGGFARRKKWADMVANPYVAFIVDDVLAPWTPRCIEVRGRADLNTTGGEHLGPGRDPQWIRIHPHRIVSFGIDGGAGTRTVAHD
jgi:pyridoxamine 5'-phosphate oxidase family protein